MKHTFKDSKNWSKVIHFSLQIHVQGRRPTIMQSSFHSCNFFADFFVHVMVFCSVVYDFKIISIMLWHTLESCATYWVGFDITCLKQNPTKGLTNFKEGHDTTEVRAMVRNAKLEPLSMMYVITLSNKPKDLSILFTSWHTPKLFKEPKCGSQSETMEKEKN